MVTSFPVGLSFHPVQASSSCDTPISQSLGLSCTKQVLGCVCSLVGWWRMPSFPQISVTWTKWFSICMLKSPWEFQPLLMPRPHSQGFWCNWFGVQSEHGEFQTLPGNIWWAARAENPTILENLKFQLRPAELRLWRWAGKIHITAQPLTGWVSLGKSTSRSLKLPQLPVKGDNDIYLEVKPLALGWHLLNEMWYVAAIKINYTSLHLTRHYQVPGMWVLLGNNRKQDRYGLLLCGIYILVIQFKKFVSFGISGTVCVQRSTRHCACPWGKEKWTLIITEIEEREYRLGTNQEW